MAHRLPYIYFKCGFCGAALPRGRERSRKYCGALKCKLGVANAHKKAIYVRKRPAPLTCQNPACGKVFSWVGQGKRKYCPGGCQQQARNIRDRKTKNCKWCGVEFPPVSTSAQHCSEECVYKYQVEHLGQGVADKRLRQRAVAKRQKEHEENLNRAAAKEDGYCPQTVQCMSPEKIDGDWDKIWKGLSSAPKVPPHRRNWDRIA